MKSPEVGTTSLFGSGPAHGAGHCLNIKQSMLQYASGKDWQICKCLLGCLLWALWSFIQWFPAKTDPKLALGLVLRSFFGNNGRISQAGGWLLLQAKQLTALLHPNPSRPGPSRYQSCAEVGQPCFHFSVAVSHDQTWSPSMSRV